jgi:prepilin-type N-terminal cleavage/methylation domain-containing protein
MKVSKGFTLIEAIITAVVVAILATIAIPLYTGYVAGARQDTVNNLAQTAAAAGNSYFRKTNTPLTQANLDANILNLFYDNTTHRITVNGNDITVTLIGSNPIIRQTVPYKQD